MVLCLQDKIIGDHGIFTDNQDSVPNRDVHSGTKIIRQSFRIQNHIPTDSDVFIEYGIPNGGTVPDSDIGAADFFILTEIIRRLKIIGPHHDDIFQTDTIIDNRPNPQ